MSWLKKERLKQSANRLVDEQLYARAVREIESGNRRDGLWGKALADTKGDISAAKAAYIELRVQSLMDEQAVLQAEKDKEAKLALERQRARDEARRKLVGAIQGTKQDASVIRAFGWLFYIFAGGVIIISLGIPNVLAALFGGAIFSVLGTLLLGVADSKISEAEKAEAELNSYEE